MKCWTGIPAAGPRSADDSISLSVHGIMLAPISWSIFVVMLMMPRKSPGLMLACLCHLSPLSMEWSYVISGDILMTAVPWSRVMIIKNEDCLVCAMVAECGAQELSTAPTSF